MIQARPEKIESRELMAKAIERLNHLAEDVLQTRKNLISAAQSEVSNVAEVIISNLELLQVARSRKVSFAQNGSNFQVRAPSKDLSRVITILIENALDAAGEYGFVQARLDSQHKPGFVSIYIEDHGSGFPQSILNSAPSDWHTTKPDGNGLGLKFVYNWSLEVGGKLELSNLERGGALVSLHIPRVG
ncbi:MAG: hypothetical protein HC883_02025 [Bdellovibrionaceae bacterium]|nr:hypothetical protein [Pseudobdellovibrionaceae bacterium]